MAAVDSKDVEKDGRDYVVEKDLRSDSVARNGDTSSAPTGQLKGWRLYSVQLCLCFSLVLSVMDSSVVATAMITIGTYFNDYVTLQWVALAYLLAYLGFALILSRVSDVVGRKWTTVASLVILAAFSLGAGLSQSLDQVIAFRALQGIGGAGLYAMAMTALPEITPPAKFGMMSGVIGIVFAVSAVLGPTIGGIISTHSTWRWVFNFNVPCCGVIILLIFFSWPVTTSPGRITLRQLDLLGCVLFLAATVLFIFALQEGGSGTWAWSSPTIVSCLVLAAVATIAFALWISYLSAKKVVPGERPSIAPLFPSRILTHRVMCATIIVTLLIGYIFYTVLVELPQRFQIVNQRSPESAGLSLLPVSGASALGSFLGGFLSTKGKNNSFYTLTVGCALTLLGCGTIHSVGADPGVPDRLYGFEVLLGLGIGLVLSSSTVVIKIQAQLEDSAVAQGLMAQSRILGGNIGLSVATIITNGLLASRLVGVLDTSQIDDLRKSLRAIPRLQPCAEAGGGGRVCTELRAADVGLYSSGSYGAVSMCIGLAEESANVPGRGNASEKEESSVENRVIQRPTDVLRMIL